MSRLRTPVRREGRAIVRMADTARDGGRFLAAAAFYEEAMRLLPERADLHVQAGHMFKEAGVFAEAETHYARARALRPDDPDLFLQLGHFYKTAGRLGPASDAYRAAASLWPDWHEPRRELDGLTRLGWVGIEADQANGGTLLADELLPPDAIDRPLLREETVTPLSTAIVPSPPAALIRAPGAALVLRRPAREAQTPWGYLPVLRGIAAVRGFCLSGDPIAEIQVSLNGLTVARLVPEPHVPTQLAPGLPIRKYVFNAWIDVRGFLHGPYNLDVRAVSDSVSDDPARWQTCRVVIASAADETGLPDSDAIVASPPPEARSVDEWVSSRPSVVRVASRTALPPPGRMLVIRTDQLGDMVASLPALRRLRTLLPDAFLAILVTAANADLARSFGLFDDVLVVDFPDDPLQRRRVMTLADQERLRERLADFHFDLALDLAPASESRPLLLLSGAPVQIGMGDFPWLTVGFKIQSRDIGNGLDFMSNAAKSLALVEAVAVLLGHRAEVLRRDDLDRTVLEPLNVVARSFVVLHTGARIAFSRWAHYPELAEAILSSTSHVVVMLADNPDMRDALPPSLLSDPRFVLVDRALSFDVFDALLSFADAFVGNDSGPKHLAALRGTPVVSIHSARINWSEWGQEATGVIVSRKVPCAGCLLYHEVDECGKGYACITDIKPDEVFTALTAVLDKAVDRRLAATAEA